MSEGIGVKLVTLYLTGSQLSCLLIGRNLSRQVPGAITNDGVSYNDHYLEIKLFLSTVGDLAMSALCDSAIERLV